jgi:hypothetical protein
MFHGRNPRFELEEIPFSIVRKFYYTNVYRKHFDLHSLGFFTSSYQHTAYNAAGAPEGEIFRRHEAFAQTCRPDKPSAIARHG